jgi:hypothetical protein
MRLPDPLARECRDDHPAYHHEGERRQASIRYIVLHSTEGGTAESVAKYFMTPQSGGSANIVVDDFACYRCLADTIIPWGAPPLNTHGFHIEQAGYAAWSRARWLLHRGTIRRAAYKAAQRCRWYKIPARILTAAELERDFGKDFIQHDGTAIFQPGPLHGGIVTHRVIDDAFHDSTHTDPGPSYPLDVFMKYLNGFLAT